MRVSLVGLSLLLSVLAAAACGGSDGEELAGGVVFDGANCEYGGPYRFPSEMRFALTFDNQSDTEASVMLVNLPEIDAGNTSGPLLEGLPWRLPPDATEPMGLNGRRPPFGLDEIPNWAVYLTEFVMPSGRSDTTAFTFPHGRPVVMCVPQATEDAYPAALLWAD